MIGLRARVHFNASASLCVMPDLVEERFGLPRRGNVGTCLPMQVASSIAACTGYKRTQLGAHILKNIGVRGKFAGWTLEQVLKTFELPLLTKNGPVWFRLAVTEYQSVNQVVEATTLGYPVLMIIGRNACDVLENEAVSYKDGCAMAGVIRPADQGFYHSYLAIGCDTEKYVIVRDTRDEYCYKGYLKIKSRILQDGFQHIKCLTVNVLKVET